MNEKEFILDAFNSIPADSTIFISKLGDIADRVQQLLDEKGWSQKDLARALGKNESEISKWLTSVHNFTLKSLSKMEAVLGADIIKIPISSEITCATNYVYLSVYARSNDSKMEAYDKTIVAQKPPKINEQYFSVPAGSNSLFPPALIQQVNEDKPRYETISFAS